MLKKDTDAEYEGLLNIANLMCVAVRTAPKGKGTDLIVTVVLSGEEKDRLAQKMKLIGENNKINTFLRDSKCVQKAQVVVLLGTKFSPLGLRLCGFCGYKNCAELENNKGICVFNPGDLGIAIGSAVSTASLHKADNRIMYSAGYTAIELKLLGKDIKIAYGIPLSSTGKNIFFDRK